MTPIPVIDWQMMRDFALLAPHIKPTTGNIFFVHATNGNAANTGISSTAPMATIDQAINLCTANHGDIVVAMPGHTESLTTATQLVMDVAGVSIIGLGWGDSRPVLTFTTVGSSINVTGNNNLISNLVFRAGIASVVTCLNITGNNFEINNCRWTFNLTTHSFVTMIALAGSATLCMYPYLHDLRMATEVASATPDAAITLVGVIQPRLENIQIYGTFITAPIKGLTTLSSQVHFENLRTYNSVASVAYNALDLGAVNTTGNLIDCTFTGLYATPSTKVARYGTVNCDNVGQAGAVSRRAAKLIPATSPTS